MAFNDYTSLPGFMSEFKDGGLQARRRNETPATESVLLLGTAIDGPVMEPVAVDVETVHTVFGGSKDRNGLPNGSTLVKAFEEAHQGGAKDIRLMRISGSTSKATISAAPGDNVTEVGEEEYLGTYNGNSTTKDGVDVVFELNQYTVVEDSIIVKANGTELLPSDYTFAQGSLGDLDGTDPSFATITLHEGVTDQNASVYITYSFEKVDENGNPVTTGEGEEEEPVIETVTENGHVNANTGIDYWIAGSAEQEFTLSKVAEADTLRVYVSGVGINENDYRLSEDGFTVILEPGIAQQGNQVEATYVHRQEKEVTPKVKFESVFGGETYNRIKIKVVEDLEANGVQIQIEKPESKKSQAGEETLTYKSVDFPTLGNLVQAINADANNNIVRASVSKRDENTETANLVFIPELLFEGGDDGLNLSAREKYELLGGKRNSDGLLAETGAYQLLENYNVDMIVPLGIYADENLPGKYDNFAYQLALACAVISHRSSAVTGVIATSTPDEAGLAAIKEHVNTLLNHKNDYFMRDRNGNILKDSDGDQIDLGRFITVVAGPDINFQTSELGRYSENSAAALSGFISQLDSQSAPTNKALPFARGLRYSYSNPQLDQLTTARFVTFKTKNNGDQVAVTDAPTAAQPGSDYRRLTTIRVTKEVINNLRDVCDPYIGEPNEVAQRNAMSSAIAKRLDILRESGIIVDYEFNIVVTQQMQLMGEAQIELTIVPPQELRQITTVVTLRPSL